MDDEKALLFIREEIDAIDSEIIALLESRQRRRNPKKD